MTPPVWSTQLDGAALAVLESIGYRAVGVAMGMSAYIRTAYASYPSGVSHPGSSPNQQFYPCPHGKYSLTHTPGLNYRQTWLQDPRRLALRTVRDKLDADVARLGAHGVLGVSIEHSVLRHSEPPVRQLRMTGTAIRAAGVDAARGRVFSTTLSASGFAQLLLSGRAPTGLAFGTALVQVMPGCVIRTTKRSRDLVMLDQLADASEMARKLAIDDLRDETERLGGDEAVAVELDLEDAAALTPGGWTSISAYATGTAVRRFDGVSGIGDVKARQVFALGRARRQ
jgi:uncharacterized protein YbjQ (UPF0145 family)